MSSERTRRRYTRLLPITVAASLAVGLGVAWKGPQALTAAESAVGSLWGDDTTHCGSAKVQDGETPQDTVRAAAFNALSEEENPSHHFGSEVAAGQHVMYEWHQIYPGEPYQAGDGGVEVSVQHNSIVSSHVIASGDLACGNIRPFGVVPLGTNSVN
jgi:hypothetical protein